MKVFRDSSMLASGLCVGTSATYSLDRGQGKRGRGLPRDRFHHLLHFLRAVTYKTIRNLYQHRDVCLLEIGRKFTGGERISDRAVSDRMRTLLGSLILILLGPQLVVAQLPITPTTTYQKEVANNTSASSTFQAQINGNPKTGNTSKSAHRTLLYPGNTTKVYAHFMGWFGSTSHMNVGYSSTDPERVRKQVSDMKSRGISGAILDWYGQGHVSDTVAQLLRQESEAQSFSFAITEDVGSVVNFAKTNNCDVTQKVIEDLNYAYTMYELSSAYMRIDGRPVVFFFGMETYFVDWNKVRAQVSGNPLFIFRNAGAFTHPAANGAFGWVEPNRNDAYDINIAYLDNFYGTALQHPERIVFGTSYPGFNDTLAGWINNRVMQRNCGRAWLSSFARAGNFYNATRQLPQLQIATWNDYEEGSQIETGIQNCLNVVAWTNGSTLMWALEGDGPPESISYFRIFISLDGVNLMRLTDVSGSTRSLSLSSWLLANSTTYKLYVKAIGKPSFLTNMSNVIGYRRGNTAPVARVTVSATSGKVPLSVTASTSTSSDADGRVVSSKIDFGDGTALVNGPTAAHTYSTFDTYILRVHVTDDRGATATTSRKINVRPATSGVVIVQPATGSNVKNYFRITAYASGTNSITAMKLYVNGTSMLTVRDDRMDTYIRLSDGRYTIGINAWDSTGAVQTRSISVLVGIGPNEAPTASLGLNTFTPTVNTTVRACTAASKDPDGGISISLVDFGDGSAPVSGTTTYHSYGRPGTYIIKATLTDNRGKSATTSSSINVQ